MVSRPTATAVAFTGRRSNCDRVLSAADPEVLAIEVAVLLLGEPGEDVERGRGEGDRVAVGAGTLTGPDEVGLVDR